MPKRPREEPTSAPSGQPSRKAPRPAPPEQPSLARRVPVSGEGNIVAAADDNGNVRIFSFEDGADGSCKLEFNAGTTVVVDLAFLGGGVVAGVFANGTARTWLAATGDEVECIKLAKGCTAIAKVDDWTFVVGKEGGDLVFVSHSGGRDLHILFEGSTGLDRVLNICVHGEVVVASWFFAVVGVWKAMTYSKVAVLGQNDGVERLVAVGQRFVVISTIRYACFYDKAENFILVCKVPRKRAKVKMSVVAFVGADLLLMASAGSGGKLLFRFETPSTFLLAPIANHVHRSEKLIFLTTVTTHECSSLVLTGDGRIAYVEAGATRAMGILPPGLVAATIKAYAEVLHAPKSPVSMLAGQTPVKQEHARANVKIEPVSRDAVHSARLDDGYQVPTQKNHVSLTPVKQEPGRELDSKQEPAEICCIDLEDGLVIDLTSLKAASSQPALLEAMSVDNICDVLAGVMISFEDAFRDHMPLLSGCLRRVLKQNLIAADSIVNFPEAKLFAMIQSTLAKDEAYGYLSQNVADNFEWRLQRFLHQLRL